MLWRASDFDAFELNIIVFLLVILRPFMYVADKIPDPGEFFLRFSSFSGRHTERKELVSRINKLRVMEIRYHLTTPGANLQVITGLFSSIVVTTGGVLARVSPEAIPWLLYIGQGVGYAQVEPELFLEMTSIYYKRLYLILCAKLYNGFSGFTIQREQFYEVFGIPKGTPVHDVITRYLCGFQEYLETHGSRYSYGFESQYRPGPKAGHPTIVSFRMIFKVRPEFLDKAKKQEPSAESFNILSRLIPFVKQKRPVVMTPIEICNKLVDKGLSEAFVQAMSAYSKNSEVHQANTLPLILKDRFNIDIFSHADNHQE